MNYEQFKTQIDRLISVFGERAFAQERVKIVWRNVEKLSIESFENFVTYLICETNVPPTIAKINEWANYQNKLLFQARAKKKLEEIGKGSACEYCCDSGQMLVTRKDDGSQWAFLCSYCQAAGLFGMGPIRDESKTITGHRAVWNKQSHAEIYEIVDAKKRLLALSFKR